MRLKRLSVSRFKLRYSHSGVLLASEDEVPWSVRQLYYDCEQGKPRLFDQGLAGFLLSAEAPDLAYVSVVFLPKAPAGALRATAVARARFAPLLQEPRDLGRKRGKGREPAEKARDDQQPPLRCKRAVGREKGHRHPDQIAAEHIGHPGAQRDQGEKRVETGTQAPAQDGAGRCAKADRQNGTEHGHVGRAQRVETTKTLTRPPKRAMNMPGARRRTAPEGKP